MRESKPCPARALVEGLRGGLSAMTLLGLMIRPVAIWEAWESATSTHGLFALAVQAGRMDICYQLKFWRRRFWNTEGLTQRPGRNPPFRMCGVRSNDQRARRGRFSGNVMDIRCAAYMRRKVPPPGLEDFVEDNPLADPPAFVRY